MAAATIEIIPVILDFDLSMGQDLTFQVTYAVDGIVDSMAGATLRMEVRPLDSPNRNIKIYVDGVEKLDYTHGSALPVIPYDIISLEEKWTIVIIWLFRIGRPATRTRLHF